MTPLTATGKQKVKQRAREQVSPSQAQSKVNQGAGYTWQMPVQGYAPGREEEQQSGGPGRREVGQKKSWATWVWAGRV